MTKSSLKTFLKGKNPYKPLGHTSLLFGSTSLFCSVDQNQGWTDSIFYTNNANFYIDVLDDGTAITYSPDK